MRSKEEIEHELELLDKARKEIKTKFDKFQKNSLDIDIDEFVDTTLNGLITIVRYYTLSWASKKGGEDDLRKLHLKIKNEYIDPLAELMKNQLKK